MRRSERKAQNILVDRWDSPDADAAVVSGDRTRPIGRNAVLLGVWVDRFSRAGVTRDPDSMGHRRERSRVYHRIRNRLPFISALAVP
jgi:hypothetical protein